MDNKFLDNNNFDFKNSMVIKPPSEEPGNERRQTRVVVDSRDRDRALYPLPSYYIVELETDIIEVTSGEVLIKDITLSSYLVNKYNNTFQLDNTDISIPFGDYTANALALVLADVLPGIVVVYDGPTDRLTFTRDDLEPFSLSFGNGDLALILGFIPGSRNDSTDIGQLVAPFRLNLAVNHYAVLRIDQFTINHSSNSVLHKSTALIGRLDTQVVRSIVPIRKVFNPPIARLVKLVISFSDYYGNPYDFQNKDHRLEIMLESKKHASWYNI